MCMKKNELPTPCYLVSVRKLKENLEILKGVMDRTGCRILLAQKAFSLYGLYPLIGEYLSGTTASSLFEARLGAEEMGKENHIFSPAYREEEFEEILKYCDHIVLNSMEQLRRFGPRIKEAGKSAGLRVNPECSTQEGHAIYDPCAPFSRLGACAEAVEREPELMELADGLHFHTLCEQNADALAVTLKAAEQKFGRWMGRMKWINFGGGHHITREDYDLELLEDCIRHVQKTYGAEVILEPGEAVALNAGILRTQVLEVNRNGMDIAILDASAACHMPDVLEMPYRPPLKDSGEPGEKPYTFRLAGPTCLAGDVIGDYSFEQPLHAGDVLEFQDMAIYTMVKNNTFNGVCLPAVAIEEEDGTCRIWKTFGYEDFRCRL